MTVPEVARALHVSRMTVKRMVSDGRLTPVIPHNPNTRRQHYQFRKSDIDPLRPDAKPDPARKPPAP